MTTDKHDLPKAPALLRFDRLELAGAFGDLGTLLPIVLAMIMINRLSPSAVFLSFGLFYLFAGFYYRLPIPVQPLKAVGAMAIAYPAIITEPVIGAAGLLFGAIMLLLYLSGMIDRVAKLFSPPVIRGIQLALGLIFLQKGIGLVVAPRLFITGEQQLFDGYPINLALGLLVFCLVLLFLDNKRFPAALLALVVGLGTGIVCGGLPAELPPLGPTPIRPVIPQRADFWTALIMLVLPQIPLTIGNACVGTADTCATLFPDRAGHNRLSASTFARSMGIVNLLAGLIAAVPMCHGTGGLAAHYRFGARTGGAPLLIGGVMVVLAVVAGNLGFALLASLPQSVLGVLLIFAGLELCPLLRSLKTNEEYFVALLIAGIALALPNMAWAFGAGIIADQAIRRFRITI